MRNLVFGTLVACLALALMNCSGNGGRDNCDTLCYNGGECIDDRCDCPPGFTGDDCSELDACYNKECEQGGGECVNGKCQCPEDYEGDDCRTVSADKFVGTYLINNDVNDTVIIIAQQTVAEGSRPYGDCLVMGLSHDPLIADGIDEFLLIPYQHTRDENGKSEYHYRKWTFIEDFTVLKSPGPGHSYTLLYKK